MPRGRPFPKGQSGNPAGKAVGTRSKFAARFNEMSELHGDKIVDRIYYAAAKGDMRAAKLIMEREIAPVKSNPIYFELPIIETPEDLPKLTAALFRGVADGSLTPSEAADLSRLSDAHVAALRHVDHANRLSDAEALCPSKPGVTGKDEKTRPLSDGLDAESNDATNSATSSPLKESLRLNRP